MRTSSGAPASLSARERRIRRISGIDPVDFYAQARYRYIRYTLATILTAWYGSNILNDQQGDFPGKPMDWNDSVWGLVTVCSVVTLVFMRCFVYPSMTPVLSLVCAFNGLTCFVGLVLSMFAFAVSLGISCSDSVCSDRLGGYRVASFALIISFCCTLVLLRRVFKALKSTTVSRQPQQRRTPRRNVRSTPASASVAPPPAYSPSAAPPPVYAAPASAATSLAPTMAKVADAVQADNADAVGLALASGLEPDSRVPPANGTLLHLAATKSAAACVRLLITAGAQVDARDNTGSTPLHYAAAAGNTTIITLLVDAGADVMNVNDKFRTPHELALLKKHQEAARLLDDLHATRRSSLAPGSTVVVVTPGPSPDELGDAAVSGDLTRMTALLAQNADLNTILVAYDGCTPMHLAAMHGHGHVVTWLLRHGGRKNMQNNLGDTPLHVAASMGRVNVMKALLNAGADSTIRNHDGHTPEQAAEAAHQPAASDLLKGLRGDSAAGAPAAGTTAGADDAALDSALTPLHAAAQRGDIDALVNLLSSGAPVNEPLPVTRATPLHLAAAMGQEDAMQILLSANANVNAADRDGNTPLHAAAAFGRVSTITLLIQYGANPALANAERESTADVARNAQQANAASMLQELIATGDTGATDAPPDAPVPNAPLSESPREQVAYPLHRAARDNDTQQIASLLASQPELLHSQLPPTNSSPLHVAVSRRNPEAVAALLERGADVNAADATQATPLHVAAFFGEAEIVDALLASGADTALVNADGMRAADVAAAEHNDALVQRLDGASAAVAADQPAAGASSGIAVEDSCEIHVAARDNDVASLGRLLTADRAAVNTPMPPLDVTPLHVAVSHVRKAAVQALLEHGADVNLIDANGATPLHTAAHVGSMAIVRALLRAHADPTLSNAEGQRASTVATAAGHDAIAALLQDWEAGRGGSLSRQSSLASLLGSGDDSLAAGLALPNRLAPAEDAVNETAAPSTPAPADEPAVEEAAAQRASRSRSRSHRRSASRSSSGSGKRSRRRRTSSASSTSRPAPASTYPSSVAPASLSSATGAAAAPAPSAATLMLPGAGRDASRVQQLYHAVETGALASVQKLLERGVDPVAPSPDLAPPLILAVEKGWDGVTRLLLQWSAHVDDSIAGGHTVLHVAALHNRITLLQDLFDAGADPSVRNSDGHLACDIAEQHGHADAAAMLRQFGQHAQLVKHVRSGNASDTASVLAAAPALAKVVVSATSRHSLLHLAIESGHPQLLPVLVDGGCSLDSRDALGNTPLHLAISLGSSEAVRALTAAGASLDVANNAGVTPQQMLETAPRAIQDSVAGSSPDGIVVSVAKSVVRSLSRGRAASPAKPSRNKQRASVQSVTQGKASSQRDIVHLHRAARDGDNARVRQLLAAGVDVNARLEPALQTPLHVAVSRSQVDTVTLLLTSGADANARDKTGSTPLHVAAHFGNEEIASSLLVAGADPSIRTHELSETPADVATAARHLDLARLLVP